MSETFILISRIILYIFFNVFNTLDKYENPQELY